MLALKDTANDVLRDLLANQPTTAAKVTFAWQIAAGAAMARAAQVAWTGDGTLRLRPRDAAWRRELQRARPVIAERLTQLLGGNVVRAIVIESPESERVPHA
jgi:Dna[CI] antecedent DciA-like protein